MEKITVSMDRMRIQEIALACLVKRGQAVKKKSFIGKEIYKIVCENPWQRTDGKKLKGLR